MVAKPRTTGSAFQAGMTILAYSADQAPPLGYPELLNRLTADNVNSVAIAFPIYTPGLHASAVERGQYTPPDSYLTAMIRQAERQGFTVMLRPMLDEADLRPAWRGEIVPTDPTAWFASYDSIIMSYAELAQADGVSIVDVGSEFTSMEQYVTGWKNLIASVRAVFVGEVTYSANWGSSFNTGFWPELDFVSIDAYFPLDHTPVHATTAQMAADWQRWVAIMKQVDQPYGKAIVFSEVGLVPLAGAHRQPNLYGGDSYDPTEQASYYQASCQALKPMAAGMYWWETGAEVPEAPASDDYTPITRPAEQELASCYA